MSWLLYYLLIFEEIFLHIDPSWCFIIHVVTTYSTLTTYFWMLCEGAYLQLLLMDTFHDDKKRVKGLMIVGWFLPVIVIIPYYITSNVSVSGKTCWSEFTHSSLFLSIPVLVIIILNIIFLSSVIRMIRAKIRAETTSLMERRNTSHRLNSATMKQAKAALFLIPILGINYLLLPFRPEGDHTPLYFQRLYDILSAITTSFQGFFVALLLCLTNSEVISLIKKRWNQFAMTRNISFALNPPLPFNNISEHISEV